MWSARGQHELFNPHPIDVMLPLAVRPELQWHARMHPERAAPTATVHPILASDPIRIRDQISSVKSN